MEMRGYYLPNGQYKGWVKNKYRIFDSEVDYENYIHRITPRGIKDARIIYYLDTKGIIGDVNDIINEGDIVEYWNRHYAPNPKASGYEDFYAWWKSIAPSMHEL